MPTKYAVVDIRKDDHALKACLCVEEALSKRLIFTSEFGVDEDYGTECYRNTMVIGVFDPSQKAKKRKKVKYTTCKNMEKVLDDTDFLKIYTDLNERMKEKGKTFFKKLHKMIVPEEDALKNDPRLSKDMNVIRDHQGNDFEDIVHEFKMFQESRPHDDWKQGSIDEYDKVGWVNCTNVLLNETTLSHGDCYGSRMTNNTRSVVVMLMIDNLSTAD